MKIGDSAEFSKTISESDVYMFAGITGDFNPIHVNSEYAKKNTSEYDVVVPARSITLENKKSTDLM